jgi:hypothetical protein
MFCALRITRNKMCIQKIFSNKPTDIIFLGPSFIRQWKILMQGCAFNKSTGTFVYKKNNTTEKAY